MPAITLADEVGDNETDGFLETPPPFDTLDSDLWSQTTENSGQVSGNGTAGGYITASGYKSRNDSHVWIPGNAFVLYPDPDCTLFQQFHGSARLECSAAGLKFVNAPISLPGVLLGQNVRIESIEVYYFVTDFESYISRTRLNKQTEAGISEALIDDSTERASASRTSYVLPASGNNTLSSTSGPLNIHFTISHDGNTAHDVYFGGVRVQLGHD
jgi:hypothetical protein